MRPRSDTLLVWTGAPCSYGCAACPIDPDVAPAGVQAQDLQAELAGRSERDARLAVLVGGEPFLRPDFLRLLATLRAAGFSAGAVTTGRPLIYPQVREKLRRVGLAYLRVQFFGVGQGHDSAAAVPGAFEQAIAGVRAWISEADECDVDVALSIRRRPLDTLVSEVENLAREIASPRAQIVLATKDAEPRDAEELRRSMGALANWNHDSTRPLLAWEDLSESSSPASCLSIPPLARISHQISSRERGGACGSMPHGLRRPEAYLNGMSRTTREYGLETHAHLRSQQKAGEICGLEPTFAGETPRACCLGAVAAPATPPLGMEATKANSFNFVRTTTSVPWTADAGECTAYREMGVGGQGPGAGSGENFALHRSLWLVEDDRLVLYSTDTGDFSRPDIERIKDESSHLFVDRAPPGVLDDFTEGMRRVLPDATCDSCANRTRCSRRFCVVEGPPFAREEAWIASYITRLRGRVLDVGCGEQLYRDELAPLVRSGTVRYTGLDPDELSLGPLRKALPEGSFHVGGIEEFRGEPESYDRILCLRSLNHVFSLDEALSRMSQLLRAGGQILVVETTPFAMLRKPEQVAAADRAPRAGHQHFRNVASEDVLPFARRHSLHVLEHQPAGLRTTNEWILLLERARSRK